MRVAADTADGARIRRAALAAADVACAAQLACLLEVSAPKPGNVSPGRHFADTRYEDFLASAAAIGEPLAGAGTRGIGATVRLAIEVDGAVDALEHESRHRPAPDAPCARGAARKRGRESVLSDGSENPTAGFRARVATRVPFRRPPRALRRVLEETTVDDARDVYAAIRQAAPGGLGRADAQDVASEPTLPLLDVMRLAADRDGIAREYATAFEATFGTGVPALEQARGAGLSWDDADRRNVSHPARRGARHARGAARRDGPRGGRVAARPYGARGGRRPLGGGAARHRRDGSRAARRAATPPIPAPPRTSRRRQFSSC